MQGHREQVHVATAGGGDDDDDEASLKIQFTVSSSLYDVLLQMILFNVWCFTAVALPIFTYTGISVYIARC